MLTDRSRIIAYQSCPRQRYLAYQINGTGLQRVRKSLPLQFGSAFHEGAELLLRGDIEGAVSKALKFLQEQFLANQISFDGEIPDDAQKALEYNQEEQLALAEALLRAWWAFEGESFLENFEVIRVEKEGRAKLREGIKYTKTNSRPPTEGESSDPEITLMFRPDALVRDRQSDDIYVLSWKTCATFGKRNVDQARTDMQSISEVWGVEQVNKVKVEGVIYKWIVKGRRDKDEWDGLYKQNSHLIYGWHKLGNGEGDDDWSWAYKWTDPEEINPKTGKAVGHTLGKGWKKVPIWRDYPGGVKAWIDDLASHKIAPRTVDPLVAIFPQQTPVERPKEHVESWLRQTISQENEIQNNLEWLESHGNLQNDSDLDIAFPQYTHSCHSYSGCPFIPICWEGVKAEPGDIYRIRESNHPEREGDE